MQLKDMSTRVSGPGRRCKVLLMDSLDEGSYETLRMLKASVVALLARVILLCVGR